METLILTFTILLSSFPVADKIKKIAPNTKPATIKMVSRVLKNRSAKYGITKKDFPIILAMIKQESDFKHIKGTCGEFGMLQVIPTENHIKRIVSRIKCKPSEKYCKANGKPDIYSKQLKLSSYKVKRFLWQHPHYALETGLGEIQFWKNRYDSGLKKYWWKKWRSARIKKSLSKRYNKKITSDCPEYLQIKKRWFAMKRVMPKYLWVPHYNWGGRITTNPRAIGYGFGVYRWYKKIKN